MTVSPLMRERPCSVSPWVPCCIGSRSAHWLPPAAFQEHPLITATLGLTWHLISLHVFLSWFLDSPDACGGRHSWRCGCMGKVHILSSKPSGSCTADVAGLQLLEHQMGIGTQTQSAACRASALSLLLVSQPAITPATCLSCQLGHTAALPEVSSSIP